MSDQTPAKEPYPHARNQDAIRRGAERISDSLVQLGVNPDETPEHGGPSIAEVLAGAVLAALGAPPLTPGTDSALVDLYWRTTDGDWAIPDAVIVAFGRAVLAAHPAPAMNEEPQAVQWAPSGSFLDGVPGEMMRFLSGPDGKTWGYGGGPGAATTFGTGPFPESIDVLPGQWVVRHDNGTFTVQDDAPAPVPDTRREDVARALALVDSLVDPPMSGRYGRYADAVLAVLPAPPVVDVDVIREFIVEEVGFDNGAGMTDQAERLAARLRGATRG